MAKHLLAIDQGTTGTTALVVDLEGATLGKKSVEFPQHFPKPGWVEHDATEIWSAIVGTTAELITQIGQPVAAIGTDRAAATAAAQGTELDRWGITRKIPRKSR